MRHKAAFTALLTLFVYYNIDRWVPLGNWNGEHHWPLVNDQLTLDFVVAAILSSTLLSFCRGLRWGMVPGTALLALWSLLPLADLVDSLRTGCASAGGAISFYSRFLKQTQVLPSWKNHFAPDAEHSFVDVSSSHLSSSAWPLACEL